MSEIKENIIIKTQNLSAGYDGKTVLRDVNISISEHDFLGVIGPNGCGKTTLMRVLLGLMKPESGTVTYMRNGQVVHNLSVGYLPQYSNLDRKFPISVYDVVLSGLKKGFRPFVSYTAEQRSRIRDVLHTLEIDHLQRRHIGELSGGQLQRVLLARAIVSDPDIVVLDEPNTYIDRLFQMQMYAMLAQINKKCAVVIVSHDIDAVLKNAKNVALVGNTVRVCPAESVTDNDVAECLSYEG